MTELQPPSLHPVHWRSPLWALATLALNTALQDGGGSLLLWQAKYRPAMRTSPLMCLFDVLETITRILQTHQTQSIRQAICHVAETKTQRRGERSPIQKLLRWAISGYATLQLIKIFALRGIPWTQAFGSLYFLSFIAQEVLIYFGALEAAISSPPIPLRDNFQTSNDSELATSPQNVPDDSPSPTELISTFGFVLQLSLVCWTAGRFFHPADLPLDHEGFPEDFEDPRVFTAAMIGGIIATFPFMVLGIATIFLILLSLLAIFLLPAYVATTAALTALETLLPILIDTIASVCDIEPSTAKYIARTVAALGLIYKQVQYINWSYMNSRLEIIAPQIIRSNAVEYFFTMMSGFPAVYMYAVCKGFWAVVGLSALNYLLFRILFQGRVSQLIPILGRQHATDDMWVVGHFVGLTMGGALSYYSQIYNAQGTSTPRWIRILG